MSAHPVRFRSVEEDSPDLRDLLLLEGWNPNDDRVRKKIATAASSDVPATEWWGEKKKSMTVNLLPGVATFKIFADGQKDTDENATYLSIRLNDREVTEVFLNKNSKRVTFSVETAGGKHWMTAEAINDAKVKLGPVKISFLSQPISKDSG